MSSETELHHDHGTTSTSGDPMDDRTFRLVTDRGHNIDIVLKQFEITLQIAGKEFEGLWVGGPEDLQWPDELLKLGAVEITGRDKSEVDA